MAREFTTVGVVGLGTMGAGIAEVFARVGLQVIGVEPTEESLERGRDRRGGLGRQVTGEHVRVVAGFAKPDRAGQPDHSGADHDHAHGSQNSREAMSSVPRRRS
jgi:hypothetical protein